MRTGIEEIETERTGRGYRVRPADVVAVQGTQHLDQVLPAWRNDPLHAGHRLRALREQAGLSQLQLAVRSGVTHEAISSLERGRRSPHVATLRALAQALDVMPAQFVSFDPIGLRLLSVAEAGRLLGVPAARIATWLRTGMIEGRKVSGQWRVAAVVVSELEYSGRLRGSSRRLDPRYRG